MVGIGSNERSRDQIRRTVYTTHVEDEIEKYKAVGQDIRGDVLTTSVNIRK